MIHKYLSDILNQNKVIDVKHFISNSPSELAVKAKSVTTVALISYKHFLECLQAFPLDHVNKYTSLFRYLVF